MRVIGAPPVEWRGWDSLHSCAAVIRVLRSRSLPKSRESIIFERPTYLGNTFTCLTWRPPVELRSWLRGIFPVAQNDLSYTVSNYGISNPIYFQTGQAGAATSEARDTSAFNMRLLQVRVRCQEKMTIFSHFNRSFDQTSETYRVGAVYSHAVGVAEEEVTGYGLWRDSLDFPG